MGTFANSEYPGEMPHSAVFHQGLHCLLTEKTFLENYNLTFFDIYNGPSQVYYFKQDGSSISI